MLRPDENPPDDKRTAADRLDRAPTLLWIMMAVLAVLAFVVVAYWMLSPHA